MIRFIMAILLFVILCVPVIPFGESYSCPDDNCPLIYTGVTNFCVGVNCRTVKIYQCGCCNKLFEVYVNN
jgi:hypothetical protein